MEESGVQADGVGPDRAVDVFRGLCPVDSDVIAPELSVVLSKGGVLREALQPVFRDGVDEGHNAPSDEGARFEVGGYRGVVWTKRVGSLVENVARIDRFFGDVEGYARSFLFLKDDLAEGIRTPVFRQERGMHVDAPDARQVEQGSLEDDTEAAGDQEVGFGHSDGREFVFIHLVEPEDRQALVCGEARRAVGGVSQPGFPWADHAAEPVRITPVLQEADDVVAGIEKGFHDGNGQAAGAGDEEFEW